MRQEHLSAGKSIFLLATPYGPFDAPTLCRRPLVVQFPAALSGWTSMGSRPSGRRPRRRSNGAFPPTRGLGQEVRAPVRPGYLPRLQASETRFVLVADRGITFLDLPGPPNYDSSLVVRRGATGPAVRRRSTAAARQEDRFYAGFDLPKPRGCTFHRMVSLTSSWLICGHTALRAARTTKGRPTRKEC